MAVVLGPQSGVFVLDVDQHEGGGDGIAELAKLEAQNGPLPAAPTVLSPSGNGRHLYFRWPLSPIRTAAIAPGVEALANRGAATLPPATKRGKPYRWKADRHIAYLPPPPAPPWLLKMAAPPPLPRASRPPDRKPQHQRVLLGHGAEAGLAAGERGAGEVEQLGEVLLAQPELAAQAGVLGAEDPTETAAAAVRTSPCSRRP